MAAARFAEKVVVISGAGSGIGRAIALRLGAEAARVVVLEVDPAGAEQTVRTIEAGGGRARHHLCDVCDHAAVHDAVERVLSEEGRIDVLINNAGIAHVGNLQQTREQDLDRLYRVNVKGVYNGMHAAIGPMLDQGGGVILNLASIASRLGIADRFAYSMTKGAVLTMTLSVARDYIDRNIRCNCICPARVHTPFVDRFVRENYPGEEAQVLEKLARFQPLGRMAQPEEVASLAAFLCCDEAAFITGSAYDIDGGVTLLR